jgi:hypothetical protein
VIWQTEKQGTVHWCVVQKKVVDKKKQERKKCDMSSHITQLTLLELYKGSLSVPQTFSMKMKTAMFTEALECLQHTT